MPHPVDTEHALYYINFMLDCLQTSLKIALHKQAHTETAERSEGIASNLLLMLNIYARLSHTFYSCCHVLIM